MAVRKISPVNSKLSLINILPIILTNLDLGIISMRPYLRNLILIFIFSLGCEEVELREAQNRPSEDGADTPGFDLETIESVGANKAATISISKTTLSIPADSLAEDAEVRLRRLNNVPNRESLASLGDPKGDVIELTIYNKETEEVFSSNVFSEPYQFSQTLSDIGNDEPKR